MVPWAGCLVGFQKGYMGFIMGDMGAPSAQYRISGGHPRCLKTGSKSAVTAATAGGSNRAPLFISPLVITYLSTKFGGK